MSVYKCVDCKGKKYCWNSETGRVVEVSVKDVSVSDCPELVILDLLRLMEQEAANGKGGNNA